MYRTLVLLSLSGLILCSPEPGKFRLELNSTHSYTGVTKNVFDSTKVFIKVHCTGHQQVTIGWMIRETKCWNEYAFLDDDPSILYRYYDDPSIYVNMSGINMSGRHYAKFKENTYDCNGVIVLETKEQWEQEQTQEDASTDNLHHSLSGPKTDFPQYTVNHTGYYLLVVKMEGTPNDPFSAVIDVEMRGPHGFLSVVDWPMLPFYGCMCAVYVVMGVIWLILCARQWRDLLRIQFWIGGVIFLGMLEKAMFLAEYQNINDNGSSTTGLILAAEVVSCAKRTLARMLVIIVSLGFGIVKPRLGATFHRVIFVGGLYFVLAVTEAYLRITKPKNDVSSATIMAGIPLAIIDSSICWWIFSALVQTTRTLRLRRNVVKLTLYRHFTNTLVFSVIASVIFMLWSIKYHKMDECLLDWKDLWVDEAFWHLLFSVILCVIMFLWRPSQNNQRYAFTPLLDQDDEEMSDDDDETDPFFKDKVTMRSVGMKPSRNSKSPDNLEDDPLKWIEENIPESENPLPVLDSDEEIETSKLEINKMQ